MIGFGTYHQPEGTWSDDSSMAMCIAKSIAEKNGIDVNDIADKFLDWYRFGKYSPFGNCFDCGMTVYFALHRYYDDVKSNENANAALCGGNDINDNGNGSLMRTLPLAFVLYPEYGKKICKSDTAMKIIHDVSSITHRHQISQLACGIYVTIATHLLDGEPLKTAVQNGINESMQYYSDKSDFESFLYRFEKIRNIEELANTEKNDIKSGGYVVDTLTSALWCLLTTNSYEDCVLKAVNLGNDTDTTAAVCGGLAGLVYGFDNIPKNWVEKLKAKNLIDECCDELYSYTVN
jgi:ADP-ribosylglycohydrolase